jgi:hypothetical protein
VKHRYAYRSKNAIVGQYAVSIATQPGFVHSEAFREVAESIHHGLRALGHESVLSERTDLAGRQHIVFGSNLISPADHRLLPGSVLYNLEQIYDDSPWLTADLLALFRAHVVWDYSLANIQALARHGIAARHVPIGYVPELTRIPAAPQKDIDVLFVGSIVERRLAVLQSLHERGANVIPAFGVYGAQRDALIARAKIVLNMHMHDAKVFEIVRVSYLLANRCFVVSERGLDLAGERPYADGIVFADYDDLVDACLRSLTDEPARARTAQRGFELFAACRVPDLLRPVL